MAGDCTCNRDWTGPYRTAKDRSLRWLNATVLHIAADDSIDGRKRAAVAHYAVHLASRARIFEGRLVADRYDLAMPDGCPA